MEHHILKVHGSGSVLPGNCPDSKSNQATTALFYIIFIPLFAINLPFYVI
jgi:hypothetical protein